MLRVALGASSLAVDPALAYDPTSWQVEYATCVKLVDYPDAPAPAGRRLVPEAAAAMPAVSRDGRAYSFVVRPGYRFSPPSDAPVTAATFADVLRRDLTRRLASPAVAFLRDVVGANAYAAGRARAVAGVRVAGDRLTIRLRAPAPDFVARLAMPFFCAVPPGTTTRARGAATVAAAGPYYVASAGRRSVVLERNPSYTGPRRAGFDELDFRLGVEPHAAVLETERGQVDYVADGVPPELSGSLLAAYGRGSAHAARHRQQYFVQPLLALSYLVLNTSRPLFSQARIRRAVNFAVDRRVLARAAGAASGTPSDQILPPGMPGFRDVHLYPLGAPDLAAARRIAGPLHATASLYADSDTSGPVVAQVLQAELAKIGIRVDVHLFSSNVLLTLVQARGAPFDIAQAGWLADYADPYDFVNVLLTGKQGARSYDLSRFKDPRFDAEMAAAARLAGPRRYAAYARLDAAIMRQAAPIVPLRNPTVDSFFSARVGCQLLQPVYGIDLTRLCVR